MQKCMEYALPCRVPMMILVLELNVYKGGSRILERGGGSGSMQNFEHLELEEMEIPSLKWYFLHSEKAKCLILQFARNKITKFS